MTNVSKFEIKFRAAGPILRTYVADRSRVSLICGPLGSGKTYGSAYKLFRLGCEQRPNAQGVRKSRWYAVRNTYPDLMGTTAKDWLDLFGDLGTFKQGGLEPPTHHMEFRLPDDTTIDMEVVFIALDRMEHVRKLRGAQITGAWLSEVKELNKAVIDMLDLRHGRYPSKADGGCSWHGMIGDTNAPDTDHWYYELAETTKPEGWKFHKQPGGIVRDGSKQDGKPVWVQNDRAENLTNLPENYYLLGMQGKSDDWIAVNLANEYGFVKDGKPVYPDYSDNIHCREFEPDPTIALRLGLDFGLTPACLFGQQMPNGQWRYHSELVTTRAGIATFAEDIKRHLADAYPGFKIGSITGDPAGNQGQSGDRDAQTVFQILKANGIDARAAHTNEFSVRVEAFAKPMRALIDGDVAMLVHPQCKVLRKGLAGAYHYKRVQVSGDAKYRDEPDKNDQSHICEAGQYMLMGAGEGKNVVRSVRTHPLQTVALHDYSIFGDE